MRNYNFSLALLPTAYPEEGTSFGRRGGWEGWLLTFKRRARPLPFKQGRGRV